MAYFNKTVPSALAGPARLAAAALALTLAAGAQADPLEIPLVNVASTGNLNIPGNTIIDVAVGALTEIASVGFDVALTAYDPSWISEMQVKLYNTDGTGGVFVRPAPNVQDFQYSGTALFAFVLDLKALELVFKPNADGLVHLQFYEDPVDDLAGADGLWNGRITLNAPLATVPEPTAWSLAALGLVFGGAALRRRGHSGPALR